MINLQLFHGKLLLIFYEFHGIGGWLIKPIHMDASTLVSRPKAEDWVRTKSQTSIFYHVPHMADRQPSGR